MRTGRKQPIRVWAPPTRSPDSHVVIGLYGVVLGGVLLVLLLTLYPFTFEQFGRITRLHHYFGGLTFGGYSRCCTHLAILEPLSNALLFMPLGFGLAGLMRHKTASWAVTFVVVQVLCSGFSLTVEVLQVFQPWRSPSLSDLLTNSLGGGLGFLCFRAGSLPVIRHALFLFKSIRS